MVDPMQPVRTNMDTTTPVSRYVAHYKNSGKTLPEFTYWAQSHLEGLCFAVLDSVGMWPSEEPCVAALQRAWR